MTFHKSETQATRAEDQLVKFGHANVLISIGNWSVIYRYFLKTRFNFLVVLGATRHDLVRNVSDANGTLLKVKARWLKGHPRKSPIKTGAHSKSGHSKERD